MSDKHPHAEGRDPAPAAPIGELRLASKYTEGGHEIDFTPNKNLMMFLIVMAVLIVASALGVWQLFVSHTDDQLGNAAAAPASQLADQHARDLSYATTFGSVVVEGRQVAYRVPFSDAKRLLLETPTRFAAAAAPEGWIHPDDVGKK